MTNGFRDALEFEVVEKAVKTIAIARKSHQQIEGNEADFDAALNELCEKWYKKLEHMSATDMALFLVGEMLGEVDDNE